MERQLCNSMLVDFSYVGNHGVHLMVLADYSQAVSNTSQAASNTLTATCSPTVTFGCLGLQARRSVARQAVKMRRRSGPGVRIDICKDLHPNGACAAEASTG